MDGIALKGARQRRFEEPPPKAASGLVKELPPTHPAMVGRDPLFPTMVKRAGEVANLLVSGQNNRKIGRVVTRGAWAGMPIYMLTLPERMTCPSACHMFGSCYGNAMHMAQRIQPGAELEARLAADVAALAERHSRGFVIRLHILGDFYSASYVRLWRSLLDKHSGLRVYGYTARGMMIGGSIEDKLDSDINREIAQLRIAQPDRFMIRWSRPRTQLLSRGSAVVFDELPATASPGVIICPAETEATACCATCGLCWEKSAQDKVIGFLKHGMGSSQTAAIAQEVAKTTKNGLRRIEPIPGLAKLARRPMGKPPVLMWVDPRQIYVEEADYQREISKAGIRNITDIVRNFDWRVLEPPLCVRYGADKFKCIDGQHTAIAAASHPNVEQIPILLAEAEELSERALIYIRRNWSRRRPTELQKHKAEITANDPLAAGIHAATSAAGVRVLVSPVPMNRYQPGDTMALGSLRKIQRIYGTDRLTEALKLIAHHAPLRAPVIEGVAALKFSVDYQGRISDEQIRRAADSDYAELMAEAKRHSKEFGIPVAAAIASVYFQYGVGDEDVQPIQQAPESSPVSDREEQPREPADAGDRGVVPA